MTCTLVDRPQYFCWTCCLHFQLLVQNRQSTFLNSDGTYLQNYTLNLNTYSCQNPLFLTNNSLHSVFPSLQDTDYLEYDKVGTAAYRTHPSWQYRHILRSYCKTLLKAYTNVRTLVWNALTMPQWLSLGVETANSKRAVRNMAAVCVTG